MKNLFLILLISQILTKDFQVFNAEYPSVIRNSILRFDENGFHLGSLLYKLEKIHPDLLNIENFEEKSIDEIRNIIVEKLPNLQLGDELKELQDKADIFRNLSLKKYFNLKLLKIIKKILQISEEENSFELIKNAISQSIQKGESPDDDQSILNMIPIFKKYSKDKNFFLQTLFGAASLLKIISNHFPDNMNDLKKSFEIENFEEELQNSKILQFYNNMFANDQIFFEEAKSLLQNLHKNNYIINFFLESSKMNESEKDFYFSPSQTNFKEIQILTGENIGNDFFSEVSNFIRDFDLKKTFQINHASFYYARNFSTKNHDFDNLEKKLEIDFEDRDSHVSLYVGFFSSFSAGKTRIRKIVL